MAFNEQLNTSLAPEVEAMIRADLELKEESPIVFYGSSTLQLWRSMQEDLDDGRVVNRGVWGATLIDLICHASRLPSLWNAQQVFLYGGGNDLRVGRPVAEVAEDYEKLV